METAVPKTKRIVQAGFTKSKRVNYERFYAIKFTIGLELQTPRAIRAFFNISTSTYTRIANSKNYAAYKKLIGNTNVKPSEYVVPANAPTMATARKQIIAETETQVSNIDPTLEKALRVLELAESILKTAKQPGKRSLFGLGK